MQHWNAITISNNNTSSAKYVVKSPSYASRRFLNLTILATDYDHYGVLYTCKNLWENG